MSLLEIDGLTHSFGENVLYKNAGFTLNKGEHIGIVGQNGTGKSTLIKICTEQIIPDSGRIVWQPNTTVGYLDQYAEIDHSLTMKEFLKSAFSKLFDMEAQAMELYEKAADGDMKSLELAAHYQEQPHIVFFVADQRAAQKRADYRADNRLGGKRGANLTAVSLAHQVVGPRVESGVVSHRAYRFGPLLRHRAQNQVEILGRVAEKLLALDDVFSDNRLGYRFKYSA